MASADLGGHSLSDHDTAASVGLFVTTEIGSRFGWAIDHRPAKCFGFGCMERASGPCEVVWEGRVQPQLGHCPDVVPLARLDYGCLACLQIADDFDLPQIAAEYMAKPPLLVTMVL